MSEHATQPQDEVKSHDTSHPHPSMPVRTYWVIFWWLMGLLVLTVAAGRIDLDRFMPGLNAVVALIIATVKAGLVILFFMHVKQSSKLTWIFSSAAFIWLIILIALTFNDYLTRPIIGATVQPTPQTFTSPLKDHGQGVRHAD